MSTSSLESSGYTVGMRVLCDNSFGTIRYVGPVDGQDGIWIGVEWDDPARGKHDGSVAGKHYFTVTNPTSASFVRPKKVDTGRDLFQAIEDKYGTYCQDNSEDDSSPSHELMVFKAAKAIAVDFVGGDRVAKVNSNWSSLERVALDRHRINGVNVKSCDPEKASAFLITWELVLRANLLSNWSQVADVCAIFPSLRSLDVSENRLVAPQEQNGINWKVFTKVTSLMMHRLRYSWNDVAEVLTYFPEVSSLGSSFNVISTITLSPALEIQLSKTLKLLDLVGNPIKSWDEVLKLGVLENLYELHLDECGITNIYFPDVKSTEKTALFPSLQHLTIDFNKIDKWRSISELAKLAKLRDVRMRHNPVYRLDDITPETARELAIARLTGVENLNGSRIFNWERGGAEIDYIHLFSKAWLEAKKSETSLAEFVCEHPTYERLLDKYNMRRELIGADSLPKEAYSAFIEIGFVMFGSTDKPVMQRVSANVAIAKLKILAKRVLKLTKPPSSLTLSYQSLKNPKLLVPLDKDSKELSFFSIESGDTVVVSF